MKASNIAVVVYNLLGKILTVIGIIGFNSMVVPLEISLLEMDCDSIKITSKMVIHFIIMATCFCFICLGTSIDNRVWRFKRYVSIISEYRDASYEYIARNTNQTIHFVKNDIQQMIEMGFISKEDIQYIKIYEKQAKILIPPPIHISDRHRDFYL